MLLSHLLGHNPLLEDNDFVLRSEWLNPLQEMILEYQPTFRWPNSLRAKAGTPGSSLL